VKSAPPRTSFQNVRVAGANRPVGGARRMCS
jgi:hypothetical protein